MSDYKERFERWQKKATAARAAWTAALGHAAFTNTDSFFDLGGTSLALTRVHTALSAQFPDAISMLDLFANPTITRTVQFLDKRGAPTPPARSHHSPPR